MKYTCPYCQKIKRSASTMETHINKHDEIPRFRRDEVIVAIRRENKKKQPEAKKNFLPQIVKKIKPKTKLEKYKIRVIEILNKTPKPEKHISKIKSLKSIEDIQNHIVNKMVIDYKILFEQKGFKFPKQNNEIIEHKTTESKSPKKPWWIIYTPMGNKR